MNIINNIRLPSLIEERRDQARVYQNEESSKSLLMRFNNLNKEIKNIQKKRLLMFIFYSYNMYKKKLFMVKLFQTNKR